MKLKFLGSGSAFTVGFWNYQSNIFLENDKKELLFIDCWIDIRFSLNEIWYSYKNVKYVYISHLHMDHAGWLEYVWFTRKFDKTCDKANLYLHHSMVPTIWDNFLSGCMKSLQWEEAILETFFDVNPIKDNWFFIWDNIKFYIVQTIHVIDWYTIIPSYWLIFKVNWKKIFISSDTQFIPHILYPIYNEADIIFHDCEISKIKTYVHSHYEDLITLPENIKNKMWLYHYQPIDLPDAKKDWFLWFVIKWQEFNF